MAYGKVIPNLVIDGSDAPYPVLNEKDARAAAGIMFVIAILAFSLAFFTHSYMLLACTVCLFTIEFLIRVFNPYMAPIYFLATKVVGSQRPEWSGAVQKRFAWSLGLIMAASMVLISVVLQIRGPLPFAVCMTCLSLLWMETSFGICVGCKLYYGLMKAGIIRQPEIMPACPGGVCPVGKGRK